MLRFETIQRSGTISVVFHEIADYLIFHRRVQNLSKSANVGNDFRRIHVALERNWIVFVLRLYRNLYQCELFGNNITLQIVFERSVIVSLPVYEPAALFAVETQVCTSTYLLHEP